MKKILLIILTLALSISIIGCYSKITPKDENPIEDKVEEVIEIPIAEKVNVENLTLLDEYFFDLDRDGEDERIAMFTAAGRGDDGEIAWDDGQEWLFLVQDSDKDFVLFDDYVQLGRIDFYIYTIEDDFYINTLQVGTANLTLKSYHYDIDKRSFMMTVPFNTTGNVNMIKSSYGY